ncbi:uncharacterized protein HaLaN_33188, partial [Haematococcus lacustris]
AGCQPVLVANQCWLPASAGCQPVLCWLPASAGCQPVPVANQCWLLTSAGCQPVLVANQCWLQTSADCQPVLIADQCWLQTSAGCQRVGWSMDDYLHYIKVAGPYLVEGIDIGQPAHEIVEGVG